jgi:hypothetical protein
MRDGRSRPRSCAESPRTVTPGEDSAGRRVAVVERHGSFAWLYGDGAAATHLIFERIKEVLPVPSPHNSADVSHLRVVRKLRNRFTDSIGTGVRKPSESAIGGTTLRVASGPRLCVGVLPRDDLALRVHRFALFCR